MSGFGPRADAARVEPVAEGLRRRGDGAAFSTLLAASLWLFREPLFSGRVLYRRDILLVRYSEIEAFVRAVAQGAWPLWNPHLSFGRPLLGDPGAQIAYPPTWLNLVVQPWTAYAWCAWGHALLSACGLYLLARRLLVSTPGALLAGLLWLFSGPFLSQVDLWHHFAGVSWLPLVTLAADFALERRTTISALGWGVLQGVQALAGSADACTLTVLTTFALLLARRREWKLGREDWRLLRVVGVAGVAAAGLSAIVWLPALQQVRQAARLDLPFLVRTYWSLHPASIADLLYPDILASLPLRIELRKVLFESREPFLASLYLGTATVGFVVAGALGPSPARRLLLALGGLSLLLSFGKYAPFYAAVAELVPPVRILRYPVKLTTLVALAWALLAGMGLDAWRRPQWTGWKGPGRVFIVQAALAVSGLLAAASMLWLPGVWSGVIVDPPRGLTAAALLGPLVPRIVIASSAAMVVAVLALLRVFRSLPWAGPLAAVVAALELCAYHRYPNPTAPRALVLHRPEVLDYMGEPDARVYVYDYGVPGKTRQYLGREDGYRLARQPEGWDISASMALGMQMYLAPEMAGRFGLRGSYDVDYRGLYPRLLDRMSQLIRYVEGRPEHLRLLRLANVTYVVALHSEGFGDLIPVATVPGLFSEPIRVFRVPDPLPRAYAVGGARVADGLETLAAMMAEDFDPSREVVLPARVQADASAAFRGTTRIVADRADRVALEADLTEPGYVVLADGYDPGWHATLDGSPVPVLRANAVFRAMPVPAGRHRVEVRYRPASVLIGLSASMLTALGVLFVVARHRRPARGSCPPA